MAMKTISLLKLGGSVITDKTKSNTLRKKVLDQLISEIKQYQQESGELLVVGHGQGSFAHIPAKKHRTKEGFIAEDSRVGMGRTQHAVGASHQLVLAAFLEQNVPAVSFRMASALVTSNQAAKTWQGDVLLEYLRQGVLPVTCGEVLVDNQQGCAIWSTERILEHLAAYLPTQGFAVARVIHVTDVPGVMDKESNTVALITPQNAAEVQKAITDPSGTDVTGGMWHKLESALQLAQSGVESAIISGIEPKNLYNCLSRRKFIGTTIQGS